jgi:hypothetical protein
VRLSVKNQTHDPPTYRFCKQIINKYIRYPVASGVIKTGPLPTNTHICRNRQYHLVFNYWQDNFYRHAISKKVNIIFKYITAALVVHFMILSSPKPIVTDNFQGKTRILEGTCD